MTQDLLEAMNGRAGHFLLESGHHGDLWLDLDRLLVSAIDLQRWAGGLADLLREHDVSAVCGPLLGGAIVAEFVAARLEVDCYYAQRSVLVGSPSGVIYRIPASTHAELAGRRVAVVDDVVNAGSATGKTRDALAEIGARPVVFGALLALGSRAQELTTDGPRSSLRWPPCRRTFGTPRRWPGTSPPSSSRIGQRVALVVGYFALA